MTKDEMATALIRDGLTRFAAIKALRNWLRDEMKVPFTLQDCVATIDKAINQ